MEKKYLRKLILVNLITGIRLVGAFMLIPIYVIYGPFYSGIVALLFFATDWVDGFLARRLKCSTFFGALFDGISDKVFDIVALIILGMINYYMLIPALMEVIILVTGYNHAIMGNNVASSKLGKVKTNFLDICIILNFIIYGFESFRNIFNLNILNIDISFQHNIVIGITVVAIIFETITLIDYLIRNNRVDKNEQQNVLKVEKKILSKEEIFALLFNHEYYMQHKNDNIRDLIIVKD